MREEFHNLQALRGIACLLVIAFHLAMVEASYGLGFNPLIAFRWFGFAGVDLFFVLSGFIIATTCRRDLGRPVRLPRYLFRRAWRIYPTFWAASGVAVGLSVFVFQVPVVLPSSIGDACETILLFPAIESPPMMGAIWTLSYELMFYAIFAVFFVLPRRAAIPVLVVWAAAIVHAYFAGAIPKNRFMVLVLSPFVLEFLLGSLMAWCSARLTRRWAGALAVGSVLWCVVWSVGFNQLPRADWWVNDSFLRGVAFGVPAAAFVFAAIGWERTGGRVRPRWLEAVGDASYSVYLLHGPCMMAVILLTMKLHWSHLRLPHAGWVVFVFAGSVLPGMLFHRLVERPLLSLVKTRRPTVLILPLEPVTARTTARQAA